MEHHAVSVAVSTAVRTFGDAGNGAVELAGLYFVKHDSCRAVFNDIRRSQVSGPCFWCDIDLTPFSTQESIRNYVISRIDRYFSEYPDRTVSQHVSSGVRERPPLPSHAADYQRCVVRDDL